MLVLGHTKEVGWTAVVVVAASGVGEEEILHITKRMLQISKAHLQDNTPHTETAYVEFII